MKLNHILYAGVYVKRYVYKNLSIFRVKILVIKEARSIKSQCSNFRNRRAAAENDTIVYFDRVRLYEIIYENQDYIERVCLTYFEMCYVYTYSAIVF